MSDKLIQIGDSWLDPATITGLFPQTGEGSDRGPYLVVESFGKACTVHRASYQDVVKLADDVAARVNEARRDLDGIAAAAVARVERLAEERG